MDLSAIMNSPGVYQSAQMQGLQQQIENAKRQAETERLIQQAQQAREEAPVEMDMKRAMAADYLARAQGTGHYAKYTTDEKQAKADEIRNVSQGRTSRGNLETAMTIPEQIGRNEYLQKVLSQLRPDVQKRLMPDDKTQLFTDDNINKIIEGLGREDPEYGKYLRTDLQGNYGNQRASIAAYASMNNAQLRAVASERAAQLKIDINTGKPLSANQAYTKALTEMLQERKIDENQFIDALQGFAPASNKPADGVSLDIKKDSAGRPKIDLVPKSDQRKPSDIVGAKKEDPLGIR